MWNIFVIEVGFTLVKKKILGCTKLIPNHQNIKCKKQGSQNKFNL